MDAFVKSFATYRTIKQAAVLSNALTLDSLDQETSTVTVVGTNIGRSNTGDWLILDGLVYWIALVKPQEDRTMLTLNSPLDAFQRPVEYTGPAATIGGFVSAALTANWIQCSDPVYSMPYLTVSESDTTPFVMPELDDAGCYTIPEYSRLMRKSYKVKIKFTDIGSGLHCAIGAYIPAARKVSFADGRSQLQNVDYSSSGTAKLTAFQDVETGETDVAGEKITVRERTTWYLAEDGSVSQNIPDRRASGKWDKIYVRGNQDVKTKVIEAFAKNKANHKLEFWSELDLNVQDDCTFLVYGEILLSYISYKRKASTDKRYYYKSGELATTATEKLKDVMK